MVAATVIAALAAIEGAYQGKRGKEKGKRAADKAANMPVADPEQQRLAAQRRASLAQGRASGGFGTASTYATGPGGIAPSMNGKGSKSLLGQ